MNHLVRSGLIVAGVAALSAARPAARPAAATNELSAVIANGPFAGTYTEKTDVECLHSKGQEIFAATFKDWHAQSPRSFLTSGIRVYKPDAPGAKAGELTVGFGATAKPTTSYLITKIPVTLTIKGKGADIVGEGKTKDGIQIRVTVSCAEVLTL